MKFLAILSLAVLPSLAFSVEKPKIYSLSNLGYKTMSCRIMAEFKASGAPLVQDYSYSCNGPAESCDLKPTAANAKISNDMVENLKAILKSTVLAYMRPSASFDPLVLKGDKFVHPSKSITYNPAKKILTIVQANGSTLSLQYKTTTNNELMLETMIALSESFNVETNFFTENKDGIYKPTRIISTIENSKTKKEVLQTTASFKNCTALK